MNIIKKIDGIVAKIEVIVLSGTVLFMAVLLIINVIMRVAFNNSLSYAEELGQWALIIVTFMGLSYITRHGKHIRMSALYDVLPFKIKKVFAMITTLGTSITLFLLGYLSFVYMMTTYNTGKVTVALKLPVYLILVIVSLGFFLSAIQFVVIFLLNVCTNDIYLRREKERVVK